MENLSELLYLLNEVCGSRTSHLLIVGNFNIKGINWETINTPVNEN